MDINNATKTILPEVKEEKENLIGTIQTVTITNSAGVSTQAGMLITGVAPDGKLQWKRPDPYLDCETCGYGPYGCDCPGGFIQ
jgi:hypothetical protein